MIASVLALSAAVARRGRWMLTLLLLSGCYDPATAPRTLSGGERLDVYRTLRIEAGAHTDTVSDLAVDRSERLLLTGGRDKTARLWSVADGRRVRVLRPPIGDGDAGRIDVVALSSDGSLAAVGGVSAGPTRNAALLFATADGRLVARLERPDAASGADAVTGLAFSPDGGRLDVGYADRRAAAFSVPDGTSIGTATTASGAPPRRAIHLRDGRRLVADGGSLSLHDPAGRRVWTIASAAPPPEHLELSSDGTVVRIVRREGARVFSAEEMADEAPPDTRFARGPAAGQPARLGDGGTLGGDAGGLVRRDRDGGTLWTASLDSRVLAVAASGDGRIAVAALGDGTFRWFGGDDGRERLALFLHPATGGWVAWTPEGFFDHSEAAWNLVGWHVNRGPRRAADFVTVGQLYDVAYRPELIRRAVAGADDDLAAMRAGEAASPRLTLERGLPPSVEATVRPAPDRRAATVEVAVAERGAGIGRIVYRLNGVVVALDRTGEIVPPGQEIR